MMDGGNGNRGGLHFAVGGDELFEGTECAATELARHRIGACDVTVYYSQQADWFALLLKLLVDTGVVAAEGAHADYGDIHNAVRTQKGFSTAGCRRVPIVSAMVTSRILGFRGSTLLQTGLLQEGDLAGMVQLMLRDPVQHEVDVVGFAGTPIWQARIRQGGH